MYKILWQAQSDAKVVVDIYTVPDWATAIIETLTVTNNTWKPESWWDWFTIFVIPKWVNPLDPWDSDYPTDVEYPKEQVVVYAQVWKEWYQIINLNRLPLSEWDSVKIKASNARISTSIFWQELKEWMRIEVLKSKILTWWLSNSEREQWCLLHWTSTMQNIVNQVHVWNDNPDCVICPSCN